MRVLLLEDDVLQADEIVDAINEEYGDACSVELLESEADFFERLESIETNQPDVAILDIRVVFSFRASDSAKKATGESRRAGLRCADALSKRLPSLPIILFTILEKEDIGRDKKELTSRFKYVCKTSASFEMLIDEVDKALNAAHPRKSGA